MNYIGLIIGLATFLTIGVFHPLVIKSEYHFGKQCWPVFLLAGIAFLAASLIVTNDYASIILGGRWAAGGACYGADMEAAEHCVWRGTHDPALPRPFL